MLTLLFDSQFRLLLKFFFSEHLIVILLLEFILRRLLLLCILLLQQAFFIHNLEVRVWLEIEHGGELAERVELVRLEGLKVETNALQVHNENIWCFCDQCAP